ncbi:glycosyltransferase [Paenibacillus marchantiophytorum]|uniref:glycosyltransferase n=1 Tax=Paenibacillus marchantiophytorum TaxID=1619310 RepID=UPI0016676437
MILPRLNKKIQYIGSLGGAQKQKLLSRASCVLFPSIFNEPFGLVMVEALACGTPVLALRNGAAPEVLKGLPQLLCRGTNEMANKIKDLSKLPNPYTCRKYVRTHFSDVVLTNRFIALYKRIIHHH